MNESNYYIPLTLNELIDGLKAMIRERDDLTGHEYVVGTMVVDEPDYNFPPGSIALSIHQETQNPNESQNGTIILAPGKSKVLM